MTKNITKILKEWKIHTKKEVAQNIHCKTTAPLHVQEKRLMMTCDQNKAFDWPNMIWEKQDTNNSGLGKTRN